MAPEALARTLRAVAAELERDPALARRIAEALAAPIPDPSPTGKPEGSAGNLTPGPSPRRMGRESLSSTSGNQGADAPAPAPLRRERGTRVAPRPPLPEDGSPLPVGEGSEVGAARVNRSFRPRLITGASPELGAGIPDPFALYAEKGEQGLRAALAELRTGSLRAIMREHRLDPAGRLAGNNDADKLRAAIVKAVLKAAR
jgi:hypothetical protein